jgi:hypothetical protein
MMKPIKLTIDNADAIVTALKAVNGKAKEHTFTTASHVIELADLAEGRLDKLGIPKAMRQGARYMAESGEILPARYQYAATTTMVRIDRRSGAWWLTMVQASKLYPKSRPASDLFLTAAQDAHAIEVMRRAYAIIPE